MRKMLLCIEGTLLLVLIACWLAGLTNSGLVDAQISNPPHFLFGSTIASSLPAAVNANNQFWVVTDGASATDCSTGSGTTGVLCYSNGSTWASVGGAAASCSNALTMNNSNSGAASGATFNCSAAMTLSANTLGAASLANANTLSAANTFSANGAASTSPVLMSGTVLTGGTGTTNFPAFLIQPTGTTGVTTWNTTGTGVGFNLATGSTAKFIDAHIGGAGSVFSVDSQGNVLSTATLQGGAGVIGNANSNAFRAAAAGLIVWTSGILNSGSFDTGLDRNAAGIVEVNLGTAAGSSGSLKLQKTLSSTACASSASPSVCGSAAAGFVVVAASATTVVVDTTAVTANSQVFVQEDSSLGTALSVTCNVTPATAPPTISARTGGTSFTITTTAPTTNPRCLSYYIIN